MEKITDGSNNTIGSYVYNADGVRYSKTAGGITTTYYYNGTTLMGEDKSDGKKLRYCYDKEGICGFRYYNGSSWKTYTYVKNLQGDIILIKDEEGLPVVKYEYEPWGTVKHKALNLDGGATNSEEDELATVNPFRYRGYYYDEESKLYYLITRYYDPWTGQFISPDSFDYLQPETIGGINLYAYCNNNPIMNVDPTGHFIITLLSILGTLAVGALMGGVIGGLSAAVSGHDFWAGFASGAVSGLLSTAGTMLAVTTGGLGGVLIAGAFGFAAGFSGSVVQQGIERGWRNIKLGEAAISGLIGAIVGVVTYGFTNFAMRESVGLFEDVFDKTLSFGARFINALKISPEAILLRYYFLYLSVWCKD